MCILFYLSNNIEARSYRHKQGDLQTVNKFNGFSRLIEPASRRFDEESDVFVFDGGNLGPFVPKSFFVSSTTPSVPGMATRRTPCEEACLVTPQYNPVCGDDNVSYFNEGRLNCARKCGKRECVFL